MKTRMLLAALLSSLLLLSCSKKETPPAGEPAPSGATDVMLEPGTGAVMVLHPAPPKFNRDSWMVQVVLEGAESTDKLPVIPLADLRCATVLNIPPGDYTVISSSYLRKQPVFAGGSLDHVIVKAGEIVILTAGGVGTDEFPYPDIRLKIVDRKPWTLRSRDRFHQFVAAIVKDSAQG
jgi:hypothetical protein